MEMRSAARRLRWVCGVLAGCLAGVAAAAEPLPRMSGDISRPECASAYHLAKAMFDSSAQRLYAPLNLPDSMGSRLVLGTSELDLRGGGDALEADRQAFEKLPKPGGPAMRSVYWGRRTAHGKRLVVEETPRGSHGDSYSVYAIDGDVRPGFFLDDIRPGHEKYFTLLRNPWRPPLVAPQDYFLKHVLEGYGPSKHVPFIEETWRPPLVFRLDASGKTWFLAVGNPDEVLADWAVYTEAPAGFARSCVIGFGPERSTAMALLPPPVRTLADLLDGTLGAGLRDGSMESTAHLRIRAERIWANVALRPWAVSDAELYNSTDEVQAGLLAWSRQGASHRHLHQRIVQAYGPAERELSRYYVRRFGLSKRDAEARAKMAMDVALRAHFTFSKNAN